jgi:hypothetical protein
METGKEKWFPNAADKNGSASVALKRDNQILAPACGQPTADH